MQFNDVENKKGTAFTEKPKSITNIWHIFFGPQIVTYMELSMIFSRWTLPVFKLLKIHRCLKYGKVTLLDPGSHATQRSIVLVIMLGSSAHFANATIIRLLATLH